MNCLLTGGAGFIGSHLSERLLAQGQTVVNVDNFNDYYDPEIKRRNVAPLLRQSNYTLFEGDVLDRASLEKLFRDHKFEAIIHLAARAGVRPSIAQPLLYEKVNMEGTLNLLELARQTGVSKFIFGSSSSVYGENPKVPFSESDPVDHPISPYAATKKAGEQMCYTYHHLYGLRVSCLRFFTVYGPRQRPDMAIHKFTRERWSILTAMCVLANSSIFFCISDFSGLGFSAGLHAIIVISRAVMRKCFMVWSIGLGYEKITFSDIPVFWVTRVFWFSILP